MERNGAGVYGTGCDMDWRSLERNGGRVHWAGGNVYGRPLKCKGSGDWVDWIGDLSGLGVWVHVAETQVQCGHRCIGGKVRRPRRYIVCLHCHGDVRGMSFVVHIGNNLS